MSRPTKKVKKLWRRQRGMCALCGKGMSRVHGQRNFATIDHILPKSHGGGGMIENLRLACKSCNEARGNKYDGPRPLWLLKDGIDWRERFTDCP